MSLVRAALRSNSSVSTLHKTHGFPFPLQKFPSSCFSTDSQQPSHDSTSPPFLHTDTSGLTYGRLIGVHRHMLKTDVINFLEGCNLTLDDVKMDYLRNFTPLAMMLQFPSRNDYDNAIRVIARKGRLYKLERSDRAQWDIVTPYDGRTILIQGIPRTAQFEEIERILSGCEYDPSSINIFLRGGEGTDPIRMATVRFRSRTQAMNAFITKNGTFCQNSRILIRVLQ